MIGGKSKEEIKEDKKDTDLNHVIERNIRKKRIDLVRRSESTKIKIKRRRKTRRKKGHILLNLVLDHVESLLYRKKQSKNDFIKIIIDC